MASGLGVDAATTGKLAQTILALDQLGDVSEVVAQFPKAS